MTIGKKVYLRNSMGYGGESRSKGAVIELKGLRNDKTLLKQEKVLPVPEDAQLVQCGPCGVWFIDDATRIRHGDRVHPE